MRFVFPSNFVGAFLVLGFICFTEGQRLVTNDHIASILQYVNHDDKSMGQFRQGFRYDNTEYKPGGPVFLFIWGQNPYFSSHGHVMCEYYAKKLNALCLLLEHRYYGDSYPGTKPDKSTNYPAGTFKYLSSDQALKDIAYFIEWMKKPFPGGFHSVDVDPNSKWVVFGCSYGGSLAAWARQRYPDLIYAAVVSSAPMEAAIDLAVFTQEPMRARFRRDTEVTIVEDTSGDDSWDYQLCTEFGWVGRYSTELRTEEANQRWFNKTCSKFNEDLTLDSLRKAIYTINQERNGRQYYMERVVFTYGELDKVWRPPGVLEPDDPDKKKLMPIIIVDKAAHCQDFLYPPPTEAIKTAQDTVLGHLTGWLTVA